MEHREVPADDFKQLLKRESDSLDDFEHLGHDSSPLKDLHETHDLLGLNTSAADTHAHVKIDENVVEKFAGAHAGDSLADRILIPEKMDSNILASADPFPDRKEADEKLDKFLNEVSAPFKPVEPELKHDVGAIKSFLDNERELIRDVKEKSVTGSTELLDRYTDSEPESDDFKASKFDEPKTKELPKSFGYTETFKSTENFKDVQDLHPEPPTRNIAPIPSAPIPELKEDPKPVEPSGPADIPKPVDPKPVATKVAASPTGEEEDESKRTSVQDKISKAETVKITEAEALFCKMGLVESLIYWRDPKKSGPVFGGVFVILLALTYFSLISVVAYLSLVVLVGTISFRIYKNIIQAVQKTGDGHPFKELLELNIALPHDKVKEVTEVAVAHLNAGVVELRRLFLVEDLVDSIKFGVLLWTLTYLGAWFNGMTLIILAWVALFTLPKVYETNKTQIDANLQIVRTKLCEITSKVRAAIPIGKKPDEKKD
ncbi:reticulon-1 isoform X2 [Cylas formicarius]|uniref:reticulon-1 isoform X2 n=1 Tax=Cylas formicarius TaxID=197179 RepID=UPI002958A832|nr:reticulon-1 isoform X2 [Cylas formicarius]